MLGTEVEESVGPPDGIPFRAECLHLFDRKGFERFGEIPIRVFDIEGDAAHWMGNGAEFCDLGGSPGQLAPDESESCRVKCQDDLVGFLREDGGEVPHEGVLELEKIAQANLPAGKVVAEQVAELLQVLRVHRG